MNIDFTKAEFVKSAAGQSQFITDSRKQIVFAGRSNVGKSSVINTLVNRKNFARVGSSPGKTTHVNYFLIDKRFYLVDLPGYGYAKVGFEEKKRWAELMERYFEQFDMISLGVLIVDARIKPTEQDVQMAGYFQQTCRPWLVVVNKIDKLKKSEIDPQLELVRLTLTLDESVPLIPFSSVKITGKNALIAEIVKA